MPAETHEEGPPRVVRGVAAVPGALSVPRRRAWPPIGPAPVLFETPGAVEVPPQTVKPPAIRPPAPGKPDKSPGRAGASAAKQHKADPSAPEPDKSPGKADPSAPEPDKLVGKAGTSAPEPDELVGKAGTSAPEPDKLVGKAGTSAGKPGKSADDGGIPAGEADRPAGGPGAPVNGAASTGGEAVPVRKHGLFRRAALPAAAALVAAFVAGITYVVLDDHAAATTDDLGRWGASAQVVAPVAVEGAGNAGRPAGDPFGSAAVVARGVPTRVRVPVIGLDSSLETLHLVGGVLDPPKGFARAGWYADGTAPGDIGPAIIAGHVDSKAGPAVFYRLRELTAGDQIEVVRGGVVLRFTVTRTAWFPKSEFPTEQVYGPTPDRQLRLITCGGVFDHKLRSYRDNLVVYAAAG